MVPAVLIGRHSIVKQVPVPLHGSSALSRRRLPENMISSTGWRVGTGQGSMARPRDQESQDQERLEFWEPYAYAIMPSNDETRRKSQHPAFIIIRLNEATPVKMPSTVPYPEQAEPGRVYLYFIQL